MAKSNVYSWRLEPGLKAALEEEARRRNESLSALLDEIAEQWLDRSSDIGTEEDRERQDHLHRAAHRCIGTIAGGDSRRAEEARHRVRAKVRRSRAS